MFLRDTMTYFARSFYKWALRFPFCFPPSELASCKTIQSFRGPPGETFCLLTCLFSLLLPEERLSLPALLFFFNMKLTLSPQCFLSDSQVSLHGAALGHLDSLLPLISTHLFFRTRSVLSHQNFPAHRSL